MRQAGRSGRHAYRVGLVGACPPGRGAGAVGFAAGRFTTGGLMPGVGCGRGLYRFGAGWRGGVGPVIGGR